MKEMEYKNRHGKRMPATCRVVENAKGTFVLLHGIGGWKDQPVIEAMTAPVLQAGYSVVVFDAADGALAPDSVSVEGTATGYREDLEDVIESVMREPWFVGPLSLGGHSLGALVAVEYTSTHPSVERLVLAAPAISWREYQLLLPVVPVWLLLGRVRMMSPKKGGYWLGRPWLFDFLSHDAKRLAPLIGCPVLVMLGSRDGLVGTVKTHRAFASRFPAATFVPIPGATHTFQNHENELTATIASWLTSS